MIRTAIIDDEPYLRQYIANSILEQNPNYEIIGTAGNGLDALKLLLSEKPEVVFLDIRMPLMDGLQVIEQLADVSDYRPFIVILSGYSEFEYAQKALRFHVFDYLLKPLDLSHLQKILQKIRTLSSDHRKEQKLQCLNAFIHHDSFTLEQHDLALCFSEYASFHVFYLCIGSYCIFSSNQFSVSGKVHVENYLNDLIPQESAPCSDFWILNGEQQNEFFIVLAASAEDSSSEISQFGKKLYQKIHQQFPYITFITNTHIPSVWEIQDSILALKLFAKTYAVFGLSTYFSKPESAEAPYSVPFSPSEQKQLEKAAEKSQADVLNEHIRLLLQKCQKNRCTQQILELFLKRIFQLVNRNQYSITINEKIDEMITISKNYEELFQNINELTSELCHTVLSEKTSHTIEHVKAYIDEHFTEPLSLDILSSRFGFSICYLSTLFKKTYQVTLNEYIITRRIQKAEALLTTAPSLSIKAIAEIVGYTDSYYFSRIFKSTTGKSPSSYR